MAEPNAVGIDVVVNDGSLDTIAVTLEKAIVGGLRDAFAQLAKVMNEGGRFNKVVDSVTKVATKRVVDAQKQIAKEIKFTTAAQTEFGSSLNRSSHEAYNLNAALANIERTVDEIKAAQNRARSSERQGQITDREIFSRDAQQRIEIIKGENSRAASAAQGAAQQQVVSARYAGKQRVLITQEVLRTIGRLEKAFGATISGIFRTVTSAVSKSFSGLGTLIHRNNNQFTDGVSSSLRSRESIMRSSFSRQEQIVSRSALRQEAAITGLRTRTQTGVLGAANRGLNISSFIGGAAVALIARSTFTKGAEFTRGLAVLQAQLDLTGESMADVRRKSITLGNDLTLPGVSALDAAEAIGLLSKQFASLGDGAVVAAQDASKGTLQLARAAGVGAEEAAQIVGSAVNVFGIAADQATAVADQVTAALKNAAGTSFGDFADAFKQAGAVFAQFQVPAVGATEALLQFDTALAVIARSGVVGSDAGTSLKQFFLQANRNVDETKDALLNLTKAAGETGTAFYDAAGNARPLEKTLDILRRGLVGLTDEQRNSTLQTIFGSDAIRVANALLGTSTEEYAKVTEQLREQGLAAKIAAAQNTGFRGALDALKSVVETLQIIFYEKINPALGAFTIAIAGAANAIFFGEGAYAVLRQALLGIAGGLAAVLAAKAGVEVIKLLGTSLSLLTTPFGAVLASAAVLGGVFAVLFKYSDDFRVAISGLGRYLVTQGGRIWDAIISAVHTVTDAFQGAKDTVYGTADRIEAETKPASRFFRDLANTIKGGLFAAVTFITEKFIPALATVAIFIGKNFIPAVRAGIDIVAGLAERVVNIAKGIYTYVKPGLQPAIDGFHELANAVGAAFGGDFSGLGSGARSALSGIGNVVGGLVENVSKALEPVAQRVLAFFKDIFSPKSLKRYALGFLDLVEELGRIIGSLATNPTFIKALAAIAAAAVVIGFRFIKGLGEGILQNLPGLFDLLTSALSAGLSLALNNIGTVLAAGFAVFLGSRLVGLFRKAGTVSGQGFLTGFKSSFVSARGFVSGLAGGPAFGPQIRDVKTYGKEITAVSNQLRILRSTTPQNFGTKAGLQAAQDEVRSLTGALSQGELAGLRFRDAITQLGVGIKGVSGGLGRAVSGVASAFTAPIKGYVAALQATDVYKGPGTSGAKAFASAFSAQLRASGAALREGLGAAFSSIGTFAKSQGLTFGKAFSTGAIAAASVAGGLVAGRAEGQGGGSGLLSALIGGVGVGFAVGGPAGAAIGTLTGVASLVGAAFGRADAAAKAFKERMNEVRDTVRGDLLGALERVKGKVLEIKDVLQFGPTGINDEFLNLLGEETLKRLDQAGIKVADLLRLLKDTGGDRSTLEGLLGPLFQRQTNTGSDFGKIDTSGEKALTDILDVYKGINTEIDSLNRKQRLLGGTGKVFGPSLDEVRRFGPFLTEIGDASVIAAEKHQRALDSARTDVERYTAVLDIAKSAFDSLFNAPGTSDLTAVIDDAIIAVSGVGASLADDLTSVLGKAKVNSAIRSFGDTIEGVIKQGVSDGVVIDENTSRFVTQGIFDAFTAGLPKDSQAFKDVAAAYEAAMSAVTPTIKDVISADAIAAFHKEIQDYLDEHPGSIKVDALVAIRLQDDQGGFGSLVRGLPITPPTPRPSPVDPRAGIQSVSEVRPVSITQVFNERVDTRAAAADIAWQLT